MSTMDGAVYNAMSTRTTASAPNSSYYKPCAFLSTIGSLVTMGTCSSKSSRVSSSKTKKATSTRKTKVQQEQEQAKLFVSISVLPSTRTIKPRSNLFHESYSVGKKLGSGTYSIVREGIPMTNDMSTSFSRLDSQKHEQQQGSYAIKIVPKMSLSREDKIGLKSEVEILHSLKHPNIIELHAVYREKKFYYLVLEHMKGGELFQRIVAKKRYSELDAGRVCKTLVATIAFLHDNKIAHRDIKPENLLLISRTDDVRVKIADFGFAKRVTSPECLTTRCGSPNYVAPEIISKVPYGVAVDMWSIGVVLYILLCGYLPFADKNYVNLYRKIKNAQFVFQSSVWDNISQDAKDFISALLVANPKKRLTAKDALKHSWLRTVVPVKEKNVTSNQVTLDSVNKNSHSDSADANNTKVLKDETKNVEDIECVEETTNLDEVVYQEDTLKNKTNIEDDDTERKDNNNNKNNDDSSSIIKPNKIVMDDKSGLTELLTDSESNRIGSVSVCDSNIVSAPASRRKGLHDTIIGRKIIVG